MIVINGSALSADDIVGIAYQLDTTTLAPSVPDRVAASQAFARAAAAARPIYGHSTGVGSNRTVAVSDPAAQGLRILRSHATSAGPLRSPERVRAMLVVRLNQLAAGGSGVSPAVLDALRALLEAGSLPADSLPARSLPAVREFGSIGTADLSALAVTALALIDAGVDVDALPFISSNAATIGDAALALVALRELAAAALAVCALTFEAVSGNAEAYSVPVESVTPFPGARLVCRALRALTGTGSDGSGSAATPARIQDPFGLRTMPQVHGPFLDALSSLDTTVRALANAPSENPVFLPDLGVAHHGGFHIAYLAQALDAVVLAAAQSAQLAVSRLGMLCEPAFTGLSPFLADGPPGSSGVMVVEYVAASALGTLRTLAQPASLQTVSVSRGVEEDASFASLSARQALDAVAAYRTLLAGELVAAVRAVRMRGIRPSALSAVLELIDTLPGGGPDDLADRDLTADILAAEALLPALGALVQSTPAIVERN